MQGVRETHRNSVSYKVKTRFIVLSGGDRSCDHIRYQRGVAALNVGYIERFASHDAARSSNVTKQPLKLGQTLPRSVFRLPSEEAMQIMLLARLMVRRLFARQT
jgi:hypothetical protein